MSSRPLLPMDRAPDPFPRGRFCSVRDVPSSYFATMGRAIVAEAAQPPSGIRSFLLQGLIAQPINDAASVLHRGAKSSTVTEQLADESQSQAQ